MVEMKEITARAVGIVERLAQYTPVEKAEIVAIVQTLVNVELARAARVPPPSPLPEVADE